MITISCRDTLYTYNLYHLVKAFFPEQEVKQELHAEQVSLAMLTLEGSSCFSVMEDENGMPYVQRKQPAKPLPEERVGDRSGKKREKELQKMESSVVRGNNIPSEKGRKDPQERKRQVTRLVYEQLSAYTGRYLAWGMLTGVRPTKLAMKKLEQGCGEEKVVRWMQEEYGVTKQKARLAVQIAVREKQILQPLHLRDGCSLYVGIPFCPSICSYCSFGSALAAVWEDRMDAYVDALCREIEALGRMAAGRRLDTVYVGGGTPTTLHTEQLDRVLSQIEKSFARGAVPFLEYTVEAGRPDSITKEKLEVIRSHPVTRISVNPQTMQQRTLDRVGRRHTVEDVKTCFHLARSLGFENVNMDLIAGLPGETAADMADTLRQVEALKPDSLTVHSLAIKRAARMGQESRAASGTLSDSNSCPSARRASDTGCPDGYTLSDSDSCPSAQGTSNTGCPDGCTSSGKGSCPSARKDTNCGMPFGYEGVEKAEISRMVEYSADAARRMGLEPYYLYRQKNIAGNFENVGYARADKAGIYNILIMEEKQTILAAGAGSMTKFVLPDVIRMKNGKEANLLRLENVKNIGEYINRVEEMIERKQKLFTEILLSEGTTLHSV